MSNKSSSSTSSTNNVANNQVGASEGAFAVGSGANVTIQNLDAQLGEAAISEVGDISKEANQAVADTAKTSIKAGVDTTGLSLGFASQIIQAQNAREQGQENFLRQQSELIASQAGVTPPSSFELQTKVIAGVAVIVIGVIAFLSTRKMKAA